MANRSLLTFGLTIFFILSGCSSESYRKGTKKVDSSRVEEIIAEINAGDKKLASEKLATEEAKDAEPASETDKAAEEYANTLATIYEGLDLVKFKALSQDPSTIKYFAEGPNKGMGAVNSVFGIADATIFGFPFDSIDVISEISILLLSGHIDGVHFYSLLIKGKYGKEPFAQVFDSFSTDQTDNLLTINFNFDGRIIQAVTSDVSAQDKNKLSSTIQLKLYSRENVAAVAVYEGKIAKLNLVR